MKKLIVISILLLASSLAHADMVLNSAIGNDPVKEKLCMSRAKATKIVPFMIDTGYVDSVRKNYPDVVFIVASDGPNRGVMTECWLRDTTGKYEPASFSQEDWLWHLINKPEQFKPGVNTSEGRAIAFNICLEAYLSQSNKKNYSHSVNSSIIEGSFVEIGVPNYAKKNKGINEPVAGKKVERYDVVVQGKAFYKPANPDLTAVSFTCLLSPMFEVKAIQFK